MSYGRAAIAATFLMGCVVPLAAPTAAAAVPAPPPPPPHARSLCAPPPDTVGPVITMVTFGRSSIDLNSGSRVQRITATASDSSGNGDPSGVTEVFVEVSGNRFSSVAKLHLTSGTPGSGHWSGRFVVSKYAHPGTYSVEYLTVTDAAGNEQQYPGFGKVAEGPNALSLHPADQPTFTVTGTPAKRPARKPAGNLSAFSFSPSSVNTTTSKGHVHVTAQFTGASPRRVFVSLNSARKSRHPRFVYLRAAMHEHQGTWSGTVRIPRWLGMQVLQATLFADYGRGYRPGARSYNAQQLHRLHAPSKLTVVSGVDNTKPRLKSLTFSPSSIDSTAGPEQVTVTAKATDIRSGVRYIDVTGFIRHGINGVADGLYPHAAAGVGYSSSADFHARLKKSSSGDWVGTTKVRRCVPSGTYKLNVSLRDVAGNYRNYSTKQLAKAHITSTIDVTSKHGDIVAPYVYSAATYGPERKLFLNFSEGVANVSTSTLAVYPLSPASSRFTTPATVTKMKCSNGTDTVDCSGSGDLVTSAVLTVAGFKPGKKYDVYANLNQVTPQLTDGNGNPLDWNYAATEVMDS
jgi:hypothetical protein